MATASMTRFFVRGMVWVAYPLMALMFGAMVLGRQSESPLIAYFTHVEKQSYVNGSNLAIFFNDVKHQLSIPVSDNLIFDPGFQWFNSHSLLYTRNDLIRRTEDMQQRNYYYLIYDVNGRRYPADFLNDIGVTGVWFSPDKQRVAFLHEDDLHVLNRDDGELLQITQTEDTLWLWALAWSPDNCRLAYIYSAEYGDASALWIYDMCRHTQSLIIENSGFLQDDDISWSYTSDYIAFNDHDGGRDSRIRIIYLETGEFILPELDMYIPTSYTVSWSPYSNQFVFSAKEADGQPSNIYIADIDIGAITQITNPNSNDLTPDWSPEGSQIAFVSDMRGDRQVFIMNTDGSDMRQVKNMQGEIISVQWQPLP